VVRTGGQTKKDPAAARSVGKLLDKGKIPRIPPFLEAAHTKGSDHASRPFLLPLAFAFPLFLYPNFCVIIFKLISNQISSPSFSNSHLTPKDNERWCVTLQFLAYSVLIFVNSVV